MYKDGDEAYQTPHKGVYRKYVDILLAAYFTIVQKTRDADQQDQDHK